MEIKLVATIKADGMEGRSKLFIEDQSTEDDSRFQVVAINPAGVREETEVSGESFKKAVEAIAASWGYSGSPWDLEFAKTKYEAYVTGECFGDTYKIEAKTDIGAKRMARKYHNPHQSNWTWYGSTILENMDTHKKWILEAGNESAGWQDYND